MSELLTESCRECKSIKKQETKTFNGRWEIIKIEFDFYYCGEGMKHRLNNEEVYFRRPIFCPRDNNYLHVTRNGVSIHERGNTS